VVSEKQVDDRSEQFISEKAAHEAEDEGNLPSVHAAKTTVLPYLVQALIYGIIVFSVYDGTVLGHAFMMRPMSPERTDRFLAEVQAWLKQHKVKQREFAEMVGVSAQLVNDWFKGRSQPMGEHVLLMQEILKQKPKRTR
jgi:DNA-binding XRE family transcriptional regulator